MKKALVAAVAAMALLGAGCQDRDRDAKVTGDVKAKGEHRLGDARPDDGHEGFFENDGIDDNTEPNEGVGGSGKAKVDVDVDRDRDGVDAELDRDGKVKVKVNNDKNNSDEGKLQIHVK